MKTLSLDNLFLMSFVLIVRNRCCIFRLNLLNLRHQSTVVRLSSIIPVFTVGELPLHIALGN